MNDSGQQAIDYASPNVTVPQKASPVWRWVRIVLALIGIAGAVFVVLLLRYWFSLGPMRE